MNWTFYSKLMSSSKKGSSNDDGIEIFSLRPCISNIESHRGHINKSVSPMIYMYVVSSRFENWINCEFLHHCAWAGSYISQNMPIWEICRKNRREINFKANIERNCSPLFILETSKPADSWAYMKDANINNPSESEYVFSKNVFCSHYYNYFVEFFC